MRGQRLGDLLRLGDQVAALLNAWESGTLTRATVLDLLRSGHGHVLIGQPEGSWIDVKGQEYDLANLGGQISLARAVARFANAEQGGIVVVGMGTKNTPDGEIIRGIKPIPARPGLVRRYGQFVRQRLYPPPDLLKIDAIPSGDGVLVLIDVPPQPEELKPFLVHGAQVDGRSEGTFISINRRRGEDSIPITAAAIHSTLAAGRALLRRGELPRIDAGS